MKVAKTNDIIFTGILIKPYDQEVEIGVRVVKNADGYFEVFDGSQELVDGFYNNVITDTSCPPSCDQCAVKVRSITD